MSVVSIGLQEVTASLPSMQFSARNNSALISFPLALWAIISTLYPSETLPWKNPKMIIVTSILAVNILIWHVSATHRWSDFLGDFRSIQAARQGQVSWKESYESLPESRRSNFINMSWAWTNPSLSILLSPHGRVRTVIANPERGGAWVPFDPNNPQSLPRSRFFDFGQYHATLESPKYNIDIGVKKQTTEVD